MTSSLRTAARSLPGRASTRRTTALVTLGSVVALALAGCSAGSTTSPSGSASAGTAGSGATGGGSGGDAGKKLTVGLVAEPPTLDMTTNDAAAIPQALLTNVYEGLVKVDQSGKIVPDLAKSWTVSPDRKTYTFDLVDNAKFTNGAPFTADDAVFSIERTKTDWTVSKAKVMQVVASAKAQSPTKLVVTLTRPSNGWLYSMTTQVGAMFSKTGVADLANAPIGTGPYRLGNRVKGTSITLDRNDAYWGTKPYFDAVTFTYFKDANALNNALLTNTIDVIGTVQAPEALSRFTSNPDYQVIEGTTNGEVLLAMNNAKGPFADKRIRQAARAAIDHKALLDACWSGRGTLIGSHVPPTDPWYEDLTGVAPYDQAKAKSLLAAAGQTAPSVRLRVPTLPYAVACGQVVKSQLEAVGFKVQMDQLEFATWLSDVFKAGDYDLSIVAHVEGHDLPIVFGNPDYYVHYKNPALTTLLTAADSGDEATQVAKMKEAAKLISEDAASDWLFLLPNLMVAKKDVQGLPKNAITPSFDLTALSRG